MRVLWLTHMQLPATTGSSGMIFGGWLEGLRSALEEYVPDLELGIASLGSVDHRPFTQGNATYFALPMPAAEGRIGRALQAWRMSSVLQPRLVEEAVSIAGRFNPDLIHVHGTEHFLGLAALETPKPAVATLQGIASVYERFVLDGYTFGEVAGSVATRDFIRGASPLHSQESMRRRAAVEARIIGGLRHFMGQTDWDRDVLKLLNPTATYYHTECIMQTAFYGGVWAPPRDDGRTVFCTSGAAPYKGVEMLIEALALLRRAGYGDVALRVAGPIPGSMMWAPLARLARRRGVSDAISWLGSLPADDLVSQLSRADVFVLPSHIENQPNSLLEAMLVGVPCVAAMVGGVAELVEHGVSGLVYHDSDAFALAASIARMLDDPEAAASMGKMARERSQKRFDRESIAIRTNEVYEMVAASRSGDA
jgi:glycosyltransferase involved in cell wall biosynthesis